VYEIFILLKKPAMRKKLSAAIIALVTGRIRAAGKRAGPITSTITWMSIANIHYQMDRSACSPMLHVTRTGARISRRGGGMPTRTSPGNRTLQQLRACSTRSAALNKNQLLLTGSRHWDHSFDTATWSRLTGCADHRLADHLFRSDAENLPAEACSPVTVWKK